MSYTFVVTTIRFPSSVLLRVREMARRERRTLSGEIATLLEEAFAAREGTAPTKEAERERPPTRGRRRRARTTAVSLSR